MGDTGDGLLPRGGRGFVTAASVHGTILGNTGGR